VAKSNARCTHATTAGRRCRLRVMDSPSGLCFRHYQLAQPLDCSPAPDTVAQDLLSGIDNFDDGNSINQFLGNVVRQLVHKRISRQDAIAYGYLSQLLLNSLRPLNVERSEDQADAFRLQVLENIKGPNDSAPQREYHDAAAACASPITSNQSPSGSQS
ncbi:MAG TPA: hypothetical protein VGF20_07250, partial [Candidatus Acidoferrum sp.]